MKIKHSEPTPIDPHWPPFIIRFSIKILLILLLLCNFKIQAQAQDKHLLRIYPFVKIDSVKDLSKHEIISIINEYVSKDSTLYLGPSSGMDVFQIETKTGNYTLGLIAGIGYGFKWAPDTKKPYVIGIDVFLKTGLTRDNSALKKDGTTNNSNDPNYFNIQAVGVISIFGGYLSAGYGISQGIGLNDTPNKFTPIVTIGTKIPL
jgi:hypothetical protein